MAKSAHERFDAFVQKTASCWLWMGTVNSKGYGQIRINGRAVYVHRLAWMWSHGVIEPGLCVLHSCDVRTCVNPAHLRLGTPRDNSLDMVSKHRQASTLTAAAVRRIRSMGGTQRQIAAAFGVTRSAIGRVLRRHTWAHVKESAV
jgi:hypothetical protein